MKLIARTLVACSLFTIFASSCYAQMDSKMAMTPKHDSMMSKKHMMMEHKMMSKKHMMMEHKMMKKDAMKKDMMKKDSMKPAM